MEPKIICRIYNELEEIGKKYIVIKKLHRNSRNTKVVPNFLHKRNFNERNVQNGKRNS